MPFVLVTGASQGIGAAVAVRFAESIKADLALVSRNRDKLEKTAEECRAGGSEAHVLICDLTDFAAVESMAQDVLARFGAPDILINNAGVFQPTTVEETAPSDFRRQVDVNLTSAFAVTHAFLKPMLERGSGHIVFMASVASIRGYPSGVAYCASKHGLLGLARALREETKTTPIKVTSIIPGATYTDSWAGVDIPESRFMPVEDVAQTVIDVCSLGPRSVVEEILIRPQEGDI